MDDKVDHLLQILSFDEILEHAGLTEEDVVELLLSNGNLHMLEEWFDDETTEDAHTKVAYPE